MRRVSRLNSRKRAVRGQTIYVALLGLAVAALVLTNVFLFMEYFEYYQGPDSPAARLTSMSESPAAPTAEPVATPPAPEAAPAPAPAPAPEAAPAAGGGATNP